MSSRRRSDSGEIPAPIKGLFAVLLVGGVLSSAKTEIFFSLGGIVTDHVGAAVTGSIPDALVVVIVLYLLFKLMLQIPGRYGLYQTYGR